MPEQPAPAAEPDPAGARRAAATRRPDTRGRRRGRSRKRHTVARVLLVTSVVLAMVTGLSVVFLYRSLNGSLTVDDVADQLSDRPTKKAVQTPQKPINILVMGDDTRQGEGNAIDNEVGGGSDTTILFHLSADRKRAYGVSIPRDSLVDRPRCTTADGETIPPESNVMWNAAYSIGGPACTMQQFEQLTGIYLDNYVVVDFQGFQDMVDAIDGVEVCIPEDISDPAHGINIPAGTREIAGKEALNYVRARYTLGDGSDIGRIKRQQAFIAAMAKKVVSGDVLTRPDRVVGFLKAAIGSLTTDFENLWEIGRVGYSFQHIGLDNIQFITVPFQYSEEYPGRVEWLPAADAVWKRIIEDAPLTRRLSDGVITAGDVPGVSDSADAGDPTGSAGPTGPNSPSPSPRDEEREAELAAAGLCT